MDGFELGMCDRGLQHQVQALLFGEPAHDAEQRAVGLGREAELAPQRAAAARLARVPQPQMTPEALMRIKIEVMDAQQTRAARRSRRRLPVGQWAVAASLILVLLVFGLTSPVLASVPAQTDQGSDGCTVA